MTHYKDSYIKAEACLYKGEESGIARNEQASRRSWPISDAVCVASTRGLSFATNVHRK